MSLPPTSFERLPIPAHQAVARAVDKSSGIKKNASAEPGVPDSTATKNPPREFSFWDLVDIVNPLQHIPVVSTLYRKITGDEIGNFARVAGGAVYGGFLGAAAGGINALVVSETGRDIGEMVLDTFTGGQDKPPVVASADPMPLNPMSNGAAGHGGALFDGPANGGKLSGNRKTVATEQKPAIPVIEVRPSDKKNDLPAAANISTLPDFTVETAAKEPITKPTDKAAIQRAMLDALLKMQEMDKSEDSSAEHGDTVAEGLN